VSSSAAIDRAPVLVFGRCRCGCKLAKLSTAYALSIAPPAQAVAIAELQCPKCKALNYVYPTSRVS